MTGPFDNLPEPPPHQRPRSTNWWAKLISVLTAITAVIVAMVVGIGLLAWPEERPVERPGGLAVPPLAPSAEADDALRSAPQLIRQLLSYDYRTYDASTAAQAQVVTPRYRTAVVKFAQDTREDTISRQMVSSETMKTGAVLASRPGRVSLLLFTKQLLRERTVPTPAPERRELQVTLVRQNNTWLIDHHTYLDGEEFNQGAPKPEPSQGFAWPNAAGQQTLTAIGTCAKTFVQGDYQKIDDDQRRIYECTTGPLAAGYAQSLDDLRRDWVKDQTRVVVNTLTVGVRTATTNTLNVAISGCATEVTRTNGVLNYCYYATAVVINVSGRWVFASYYQ